MVTRGNTTEFIIGLGAIGVLVVGLALVVKPVQLRTSTPAMTSSKASSLHTVRTIADRPMRTAESRINGNPNNIEGYVALATAFVRKARESGDMGYYQRAEATVQEGLTREPRSYEALRVLAWIKNGKHEFQEALAIAGRLVRRRSHDQWAYGLLGDAAVELGEYNRAAEAYQMMVDLRPGLPSYSRAAHMRELFGDRLGAIEIMTMAVRAGSRRDPEGLAWSLVQLGHLHFNQGDLRQAEVAYQNAHSVFSDYYPALAGLGRVRAGQKRYGEAIVLYHKAVSIVHDLEFVAALGDIQMKTGRVEDAKKQYRLVESIGYLNNLNNFLDNRELAYFYADHDMKINRALELARKELEVRKDIYAYDLLAWALYKNGQPQEALAAVKEALRLGTKDAKLFFHAGMIHYRLGHAEEAKKFLRLAVTTNRYFHIFYGDMADETLKELVDDSSPVAVASEGDAH